MFQNIRSFYMTIFSIALFLLVVGIAMRCAHQFWIRNTLEARAQKWHRTMYFFHVDGYTFDVEDIAAFIQPSPTRDAEARMLHSLRDRNTYPPLFAVETTVEYDGTDPSNQNSAQVVYHTQRPAGRSASYYRAWCITWNKVDDKWYLVPQLPVDISGNADEALSATHDR